MGMGWLTMLLGFASLCVVFLIVACLVPILAIVRGTSAKRNTQEETELMQEINRGLRRMEDRVEALETILLDADKPRSDAKGGGQDEE